jgi:uncharacterized membrane-anchored protein YitT (DUF2179 family)
MKRIPSGIKITKGKAWSIIRSYSTILFGLMVYSIGLTAFLLPAQVIGGGITGVATLIYFATKFPVGLGYFIINLGLLVIAIRMLGGSFGFKTIYAVIVLSLTLSIFQAIFTNPIVKDPFMATVIGSILTGAGIGIVFTQGGSTGGTDIIAMVVHKYRNVGPGRIILILDVIIISSSYFLFQSIERMMYGYVSMGISSYVIDTVLSGSKQSVQILIFSARNDEIADRIGKELGRGITMLDAHGWYSKEKKNVLLVLVKKYESNEVFRIIKEVDPEAFTSLANVSGVFGEGFDQLKA